ncbi:lipocalin family protein [Ideonella sp.]|uniref:lipocalin family protein n=1 Tax=Ideonella sp. TaxID=1929293 RepID=UPI002B4A491C|nr:lipocalin family protein [Ideonella sp.]HJV71322.1 lipocalin family protein [Ideonella sp.]
MPAPTQHRPSPGGDTADHDDLEARIRRAELDLIARDQRVRLRLATLGERVQRARQPGRWALPVAGGAALLLVGWWLSRRVQRRGAAQARADAAAPRRRGARAAGGGLGLLQLLTLAWPLLPEAWRARWGPTSTAALFNLGSLAGGHLARHLFDRDAPASALPPLHTVAHVDLGRYAGTWHEIARLPSPFEEACSGQPQVSYTLHDDRIEVAHRCPLADGQVRRAEGEARVVPGSGGARLKLSYLPTWLRWLPGGWSDCWILHVDEGYTVAVVGEPRRRTLWLLARRPRVEPETLQLLIGMARAQGFPVKRLVVSQPGGHCGARP